jgi:hypothetical protein
MYLVEVGAIEHGGRIWYEEQCNVTMIIILPSRLLLVKNGISREQRQLAMHSAAAMLLWTIGHVSEAISSLRVGSQMTPTSLLVAVIHNRYIAAAAVYNTCATKIICSCCCLLARRIYYIYALFLSFFLFPIIDLLVDVLVIFLCPSIQ